MVGVGEVVAERYELEELLGAGGMSCVYRAHDRDLDRTVAVKVLHERLVDDSDALGRFRREAETAAGLTHENVVAVIDRGEDEGQPFIVYEYVGGTNLKQILQQTGPLPLERALRLVIQIARGLAHAHARGTIHRDVKPHNVLVDGGGQAKVTDFGIARSLTALEAFTLTGTVLGSVDYIAPEQAQGQTVDERTDVYALGVVLHELLTGELPFTGASFVEVALQHVNDEPPRASQKRAGIPLRIDAAMRRALAKRPERRFATMAAFADELEAALAELQGERAEVSEASPTWPIADGDTLALPPDPTLLGRAPAPRRTRLRLPGAVALLALIGAVAGGLAILYTPAPTHTGAADAAAGATVGLLAVAPYDPPPGDGIEDNGRLRYATDGNPATAWATEWYANARFGNLKSGVGIVLAAPRSVRLASLTLRSDTPGFSAIVKSGSAPAGPFRPISASQRVGSRTIFRLSQATPSRYFLVWITDLPPQTVPRYHADINEVTATGL